MENRPARPYVLWRGENAVSLYYIDQKHLYTIGKRCTCDITFPNSNLLPTHACLHRSVRRNRVCYSITPCSTGNVLVNDVAVSCGQKKELAFHDVITLVEGPQCIHLTFSQKRGTGIVDSTRPCLTWESNAFSCVRYLEEKKLFTIGSDRGCDISLATPYLASIHAELTKNVLKGTVQYSIKPAPTRRANLFVNGLPVSRRGQKNLVTGDVLTVSRERTDLIGLCSTEVGQMKTLPVPAGVTRSMIDGNADDADPNSISFCFHNGEGETAHEVTSSPHRELQPTVSSPSPVSSAPRSQSRRRGRSSCTTKRLQTEDVPVNHQVIRPEPEDNLSLNQLEANLTCCVCLNIFFKPVNIDPCNHKCCYSCVLSWLRQSSFFGQCPQCRVAIVSVKLDPALNSIVETFLHMKPVLRRSREEIALIEASEARNLGEYQQLLTADALPSHQPRTPNRRWMQSGTTHVLDYIFIH